jgi:cell division septum initiation protein DivIVA
MLTAEQIQKHNFRSAGKGLFRSEDVEAFLKETAKDFGQLQESAAELKKNNDELYQRVEALANALNQLRAERELIQKTMILAQKAADEIGARAQEESEQKAREVQAEAEKIRSEAKEEATKLVNTTKLEVERLMLETRAQAENIQAQAKSSAECLFEEARAKAQQELVRISGETQREQQELQRLRLETNRFRTQLLDAVARQMEFIEQMPEDVAMREEAQPLLQPQPAPPPQAQQPTVPQQPEPLPEPEPPKASPEPAQKSGALSSSDMFADLEAALGNEEGFRLTIK